MWQTDETRAGRAAHTAGLLGLALMLVSLHPPSAHRLSLALASVVRSVDASRPDSDNAARASREKRARAMLAGEHVLSAYSGVSHTAKSDVHVTRPDGTDMTIRDVGWDGRPFWNPIYYGARVATWLKNTPFGVMLDFTHAKAISRGDAEYAMQGTQGPDPVAPRARLNELFDKLEFSHGHNILLVNGLYRLPLGTDRLSPYAGIGAGVSIPHLEIDEKGVDGRTYAYQITGPAFQVLIGVELRFAATSSVFVEYKASFSPYTAMLTDAGGGTLTSNLLTSHLIGGFSIRASRAPTGG